MEEFTLASQLFQYLITGLTIGSVYAMIHSFHAVHTGHIAHTHHAGLIEFTGFNLTIWHAHGARGGKGEDLFEIEMVHGVIEVWFRHFRRRVAFAGTYPS